jgi:large subunit ribosomal protein L15
VKLHHLKPAEGSKTRKRRVGRGDKARRGAKAGRGTKGQHSRGSGKLPPGFEGGQMPLQRRQPKLGGSTKPSRARRDEITYAIVNVRTLEEAFAAGEEVSASSLKAKGLIARKSTHVKVLGDGDLTKSLTVKVDELSSSAHEKITAAGGTVG